jgi:hypothetical protein
MTPALVEFGKQEWSIDYNYASFLRIQDTQLQDIPLGSAVSDVAKTWIDEKFVPDFDEYALAKVIAARPGGNIVTWDGTTFRGYLNNVLDATRATTFAPSISVIFSPNRILPVFAKPSIGTFTIIS